MDAAVHPKQGWMDYKKLNRRTQAESSKAIHSWQLGWTSFTKQFA